MSKLSLVSTGLMVAMSACGPTTTLISVDSQGTGGGAEAAGTAGSSGDTSFDPGARNSAGGQLGSSGRNLSTRGGSSATMVGGTAVAGIGATPAGGGTGPLNDPTKGGTGSGPSGGAGGIGGSDSGGASGGGTSSEVACLPSSNCKNTDQAHCECSDQGGGSCGIRGKDADGDGHRDSGCTAAALRGDDCDDSKLSVFSGAKELCDGLDNDCDGKSDLDDGLGLGGTTLELIPGGLNPRVAWSAAVPSSFGIAWSASDENAQWEVWFQRMSATGALIDQRSRVSPNGYSGSINLLAMAAGPGAFGVLYTTGADSKFGATLHFQRMALSGGQLGTPVSLVSESVSSAGIEAAPGGGWFVFWQSDTNKIQGVQLDAEGKGGVARSVTYGTGDQGYVGTVRAGDDVGLAYVEAGGAVYWSGFSANLSSPQDLALTSTNTYWGERALGGNSSGYALAWSDLAGENWKFQSITRDGKASCGAVALPTPPLGGTQTSMLSRGQDWLVGVGTLESKAGGRIPIVRPGLLRVGAKCDALGTPTDLVDKGRSLVVGPYLAGSPTSVLAVWSAASDTAGRNSVFSRMVGNMLCDGPS